MEIECVKEKLTEAIVKAERVLGKNTTLPILSCFLLVAKDKNLVVKATNLDIGVEINLPSKVVKEGVVAVPGHLFSTFVASIRHGKNVTLKQEDGNDSLLVKTEQSSTTIKTLPFEDFPLIPRITPEGEIKLKGKDFALGVKSVSYSASVSTIKPELGSIYIYQADGKIFFVATDSFRLSEKKINNKQEEGAPHLLIPLRNAIEIAKFIENTNEDVSILVSKNQISLDLDGVYLTSRVVDGSFPDYKQIIPKQSNTSVTVLKQDLADVIRATTIFSDKFNQIKISTKAKDKILSLETKNQDVGETVEDVSATISGEDIEASFNHRYISDCLSAIPGDSVSLSFSGQGKPLIIEGVSDKSFLYLVMPMNR